MYCFPLLLQVTLPVSITPRYNHSAVAFGIGPNFKVVVVFGGAICSHEPISETTLLLLGECILSATNPSTQVSCSDILLMHCNLPLELNKQRISIHCFFRSWTLILHDYCLCGRGRQTNIYQSAFRHYINGLVTFFTYLSPFPILHPTPPSPPLPSFHHIFVMTITLATFPLSFFISHSPLELRKGSWQVTRVVKPDELGRPDESLKEQMRKLKFSSKEGEGTLSQTSCTHHTHSLLHITHGVHCVIRSHSINNMSANPHRRVWGCTTHACLSFLGESSTSSCMNSYMQKMFSAWGYLITFNIVHVHV